MVSVEDLAPDWYADGIRFSIFHNMHVCTSYHGFMPLEDIIKFELFILFLTL
jgi:hypothetical protein